MSFTNCKRLIAGAGVAMGAWLVSLTAAANPHPWQINLDKGVTSISHQTWDLHMAAFYVCLALGVIVFGIMFVAIIRFRKSKGAVASTWHEHLWIEIGWTVVPVLILIGLATPATLLTREIYNTTGTHMTVKVTGYQWLWRYDYISYEGKPVKHVKPIWSRLAWDSNTARQLDSGVSPYSVVDKQTGYHDYLLDVTHPLVIPAGVKVRFLITGADVIHGWWVPDFAVKRNAIPGIMNDVWAKVDKPGIYRGQCYVLCGQDHSAMPVVVKVLPRAQFNAWLAADENPAMQKAAARFAKEWAPGQPQPALLESISRTARVAPPKPAPTKG